MKKLSLLAVVAGLMFGPAIMSAAAQGLIARVYFAGAQKISANRDSLAFTNEFGCAEAKALESQTLDKLARAPGVWFKTKLAAGAGDGAAQLRPLLDDLPKSEWLFEMSDAPGGSPEYALAIRLDSARAELWSKNLAAVLQSWTGLGVSRDKSGNWWLRKHDAPNLFQFSRAGNWVVIDCGQNVLGLGRDILKAPELNAGTTDWLSAKLDWPRLARLFPRLGALDLPQSEVHVTGQDGNFLINGRLTLAQSLPPLAPWRVPTNVLHMPFMSFTAVRGITPWLERQSWAAPYVISPMPDQYFVWALPQAAFETFAAAPVTDGNSALAQLDARLPHPTGNLRPGAGAFSLPIRAQMASGQISMEGLPFAAPFVKVDREKNGEFLFGGFFPNSPRSQPLPAKLFERLATPSLVYYHWEITAVRSKELPQLGQLLLLASRHRQVGGLAEKWITKITPAFGNSVTMAVQAGPREITFTRTAPGGLTGMEFFALAAWLEAPNFPGCDLKLPPRPEFPRRPQRPAPGAPAAPFQLHQLH